MEQVIDPGVTEDIEVSFGDTHVYGHRQIHTGPQSPAQFNIGYVQTGYHGHIDIQPTNAHLTDLGLYARLLAVHARNPAVAFLDANINPAEAAELARMLDESGQSFAWSVTTVPVRGDASGS